MDGAEIEIGKKGILAVRKELVPGVGRGIAAADQHVDAGLFTGAQDRLAHEPMQFPVAEHVGAPAGDRQAFPGLVPQLDCGDRSARPAKLTHQAIDEILIILVALGQPNEIFLAADHDALVVQVRTSPAQWLLGGACANLGHHGDALGVIILEFLADFRPQLGTAPRIGGFVGDAPADGLHAQASENGRRHFFEGLPGILHPLQIRFECSHVTCQVAAAQEPQIENQGIAAPGGGGPGLDGQVAPASGSDIDLDGDRRQVFQFAE